ncbi:MAG: hypothetical protein ACOCUD_01100 [Bacillota bacterium]
MTDKNELFNPKNPIWLEILRIYTIVITGLGLFASFITFITFLVNQGIYAAIVISILITLSTLIFYVIHMVILNALYNLQKTRINTDKLVEILSSDINKTHE